MSVTKQLLELFRVDKQLRGLRSRLEAAERFYSQQSTQLAELEKQRVTLDAQAKSLKATSSNEEGEAARLEAKINVIREQMNSAKTSKEYTAFQTELNTYKEQKSQFEDKQLSAMTKIEEIDRTLTTILTQHSERVKIVATAKHDRDARAAEIKDRVAELQAQRDTLAKAIPARELSQLDQLIKLRGDEAMSQLDIIDRRSHECSCSACMMALPVETVSSILSHKLVSCPSCRCFLYAEDEQFSSKNDPAPKPKAAPRKKKAPKAAAAESESGEDASSPVVKSA